MIRGSFNYRNQSLVITVRNISLGGGKKFSPQFFIGLLDEIFRCQKTPRKTTLKKTLFSAFLRVDFSLSENISFQVIQTEMDIIITDKIEISNLKIFLTVFLLVIVQGGN